MVNAAADFRTAENNFNFRINRFDASAKSRHLFNVPNIYGKAENIRLKRQNVIKKMIVCVVDRPFADVYVLSASGRKIFCRRFKIIDGRRRVYKF